MRTGLALAFTSLLALSGPALAQTAGSPGATGTGPTGSGSNPPGSGVMHPGDPAPAYQGRTYNDGMNEGRAAAPDTAPDGTTRNGAPMNGRGRMENDSQ